eukprot:5381901-Amphidinium_carterae.2
MVTVDCAERATHCYSTDDARGSVADAVGWHSRLRPADQRRLKDKRGLSGAPWGNGNPKRFKSISMRY